MRCSRCGNDNREGRKFCAQCGQPLKLACPSCDAPNEPQERFCGDCGAALVVQAQAGALTARGSFNRSRQFASPQRRPRLARTRGRAQDGHCAVRRHQGLDGADARSRSRRGARDRRPGAAADDGGGASLRRLRRAIDRRRHFRAVRRAGRPRGPSAARTSCGAGDAGGVASLCRASARGGQDLPSKPASG